MSEYHSLMAMSEVAKTETVRRQFSDVTRHGADLIRYLSNKPTALNAHELTAGRGLKGFILTLRPEYGGLIDVLGSYFTLSSKGVIIDHENIFF